MKHRINRSVTIAALLVGGVLCGLSVRSSSAESLWEKRQASYSFGIRDTQARSVGDLLTIIVSEDTNVDNRENRAISKESDSSGAFDFSGETGGSFSASAADAKLGMNSSSDRNFDGSAQFQAVQKFVDRVTVTVMDVLPNGNLVVAGKRRISIAGDAQVLVVTGVVRPTDVEPANSVQSKFVGELVVTYEPTGPNQKFVRQGWFSRMANVAWPF